MQVRGREYQLLNEALVDAFDLDSLPAMLQFGLEERLDVVVGRGKLKTMVFDLIEVYRQRDQVEKLVQAARRYNPTNGKLHEVAQSLGRATQVTAHIGESEMPVGSGELEKLIRRQVPQLNPRTMREQMMRVEGVMCVIERRLPDGRGAALGSGFLVGPDTVLTNYHVVEGFLQGSQAKYLQVRFDALLQENGVRQPEEGVVVAVDEISVARPYTKDDKGNDQKRPAPDELDFAILLLAEEAGYAPVGGEAGPLQSKAKRGWIRVPATPPVLAVGDPLIIYQFPGGRELLLAIDTEAVVEMAWDSMRLRYRNNTEGGSSGSPVFTLEWEPVALHHYAGPGKELKSYNQGIPLEKIAAYVKSRQMAHLLGE
jgi:V8-like Glu-specific endopeptidase